MSQEIYITTAIPYVNGAPHVGHAEDYLLADIYARYQTMRGKNVRFQAGTDEHGNKIEKKAGEQQIDIKEYVDQNSAKFQNFLQKFDIKYTDFIRTTDPSHIERVQKIWQRLEKHIYSSSYDGWYCEGCERFVTQKEYEENQGTCPDHQAPYQHLTESNYYFRVSDFKDEIKAAIENGKMQILPEFRKNEILRLLEDAPDVSISRPVAHLKWGIPVPGDESQVMYVWMDALTNYITILGYPDQDISSYWPATVQVVGKDILRFHAILWPAILLGLGLPLPRTILSHGFIQVDGQKISKSLGNGIDPVEVLEKHGINAFRYFFSKHIDTFLDADFTWEKFENAYRNELANDYGNLVQRLSVLCQKNSVEKLDFSSAFVPEYAELMDQFEFTNAINKAWGMIQDVNRHIEEQKPWQLAKTAPEQARVSLSGLVKELLIANHHLKPFLPVAETVESIFTGCGQILPPETPLFPKD